MVLTADRAGVMFRCISRSYKNRPGDNRFTQKVTYRTILVGLGGLMIGPYTGEFSQMNMKYRQNHPEADQSRDKERYVGIFVHVKPVSEPLLDV